MESISIFDIFKIGVGPSSSHTLGPWKAANDFAANLTTRPERVAVHLYGSLSKTGRGHATDIAVQLGLEGHNSITIPTEDISNHIKRIADTHHININGQEIPFFPETDIIFEKEAHDLHPNTLIFKAYQQEEVISREVYASVGGGFIEKEGLALFEDTHFTIPYPINEGKDILKHTERENCRISDIVWKNERHFRSEKVIDAQVNALLETILDSVYRGCIKEGILPGGLHVKRRAKALCQQLTGKESFVNRSDWMESIRNSVKDFTNINKWISCFALAVNEENASLSRIVTSPTNGAAGVIPAVILYYYFFCPYEGRESVKRFLFTAGEIGCLFKKKATISAAVGGCQAEIGVSSAMAAAGLTEVMGGSPKQALMAAEIAMEHHLGMTCDPIGGLVQIPCIERNAMGAIKAITASNLALTGDPDHAKVDIDTVIQTMWQTALDMNHKYKETSEGGLALSLPVFMPNC